MIDRKTLPVAIVFLASSLIVTGVGVWMLMGPWDGEGGWRSSTTTA